MAENEGGINVAVAVISEFNPFHNGHKYLVDTAKEKTGESVIVIMSGSFVQRGEVAVADKFERAEIALKNGVDLVAELPAVYAVANAQRFAECGVKIARSFGCVNYLAFGCETDDISLLKTAAYAVDDAKVGKLVARQMKSGCYYPRALEYAVRRVFGNDVAEVFTTPNNILALEYLRALKGSNIVPLPIKRTGAAHDSSQTSEKIASASQIRQLLRSGGDVSAFVPCTVSKITYAQNLERAVLYKLRSITSEELAKLPDVNEGLENRIYDAVHKYNSVEEIISAVKTKRYTHARLRRIIACAVLGITEALQNTPCEYVRVLGFTSEGEKLLKSCGADVVTSVAKALKNGGENAKLLEKDLLASDILALAYDKITDCGADFYTQIIKI